MDKSNNMSTPSTKKTRNKATTRKRKRKELSPQIQELQETIESLNETIALIIETKRIVRQKIAYTQQVLNQYLPCLILPATE